MKKTSRIVKIEPVGEKETVDIEVSGNHLFYANGILTHNSAQESSDVDLTNTSESFGLPATVDLQIGIIFPAELREQNIQIWKILKNRFGGVVNYKIPISVNFARVKLNNMGSEGNGFVSGNSADSELQEKIEEKRRKLQAINVSDDFEDDILDGLADFESAMADVR